MTAGWADRRVTLSVGFVPDGSSDSDACNPADRLADPRGGMAHRQAANHDDAGGNTASQGVRRRPAYDHAPVPMERLPYVVVMRGTCPPGPARAAHLRTVGHFKATIDRMGVGLQS